jgi:hypothetical protein
MDRLLKIFLTEDSEEKKQKIARRIIVSKLYSVVNVSKNKFLKELSKKDRYDQKYWSSFIEWTSEQRNQFVKWFADTFSGDETNDYKKILPHIFNSTAFELYKDTKNLGEILANGYGWKIKDKEIRSNKPDYLYVNAPERMPNLWTRDEFNNCSYFDLSRFWCNNEFAIEDIEEEQKIRLISHGFYNVVSDRLIKIGFKIWKFTSTDMTFVDIPYGHFLEVSLRKNRKRLFFHKTIKDAIEAERTVVWE